MIILTKLLNHVNKPCLLLQIFVRQQKTRFGIFRREYAGPD